MNRTLHFSPPANARGWVINEQSESREREGLAKATPVVSGLAELEPGLLIPNILPPPPHRHCRGPCH